MEEQYHEQQAPDVTVRPPQKKVHWITIMLIILLGVVVFIVMVVRSLGVVLEQQRSNVVAGAFTSARIDAGDGLKVEGSQMQVHDGDHPVLGSPNPQIQIVEFSDFECPFCQAAHPVLRSMIQKHGDKVQLQYRHFPVASIHPRASFAAEASECARDQGKFWEYHDVLFQNQDRMEDDDLVRYAGSLGMDVVEFTRCYESQEKQQDVADDFTAGLQAGVVGTPTFFVNGFPIQGVVPIETWEEIIDRVAQ